MDTRATKKSEKKPYSRKNQPNYRRNFDPTYQGTKNGEVNNEPSQTTPDMSLTVKELLLNHSRGISSNVHQAKGQFFDADVPRMDMDMIEKREYQQNLKDQIIAAQKTAQQEINDKAKLRKETAQKTAKKKLDDAKKLVEKNKPINEGTE